jgi:Ca2+-binding RTX toxin-like protein
MVWHGLQNISLTDGAALQGGGNGLHDLSYTFANGNTWIIGDNNDNGVLDDDDVAIEFVGIHNFNEGDFDLNFSDTFITVGTDGDDTITGTEGDDVIFALGGNDQVFALGGNDEVHGGTGDDFIDGGPMQEFAFDFDQLFGEEGNDTITLQTSNGSAFGGDGNDTLIGTDVEFGFDDLHGDAGDDILQAGSAGSNMNGDTGADQLVSGAADDQMAGGFDFDTFELDGAQDLFVYTGTGRWSEEGSFFGDQVDQFEDGIDKFDMRGSGLTFADLVIDNDADFGPTITSDRGQITVFTFGVIIDESDFLF